MRLSIPFQRICTFLVLESRRCIALGIISTAFIAVCGFGCSLSFASQNGNDADGLAGNIKTEMEPTPEDCDFIATHDGSVQRYVKIDFASLDSKNASRDLSESRSCLIALHGHGSDRWQFIQQTRDEVRAVKDFASRHKMLYVSPDYRAPTSWMGPAAEQDLKQIINELKHKYSIEKLYLCGGSMGGTAALTFAALHPTMVDGVVSFNGLANHLEYENFQDAIKESFGGTKQDMPEEYKRRSAEYWPDRLTMPIGMTVDTGDEVVPPFSCVRLAAILKKLGRPVLLVESPDSGHDTNYEDAMKALEFVHEQSNEPRR